MGDFEKILLMPVFLIKNACCFTLGWESEDDGGDQKVHCKYGIDFVEFQERAEVMLRLLHKRLPRLMGHCEFF